MTGQLWIEYTESSGDEGSSHWGDVDDAVIDDVIAYAAERIGRGPDTIA